MSDGLSDARREERLINAVMCAAYDLEQSLLATGDLAFFKVNPAAIRYANEQLSRTGYRLAPIKPSR